MLCIYESFLKCNTSILHVNNYDMYRYDIQFPGQRGLAIYVKNSIKVRQINFNIRTPHNIEYCIIKIQAHMYKSCLICLVYRHPNYKKSILNEDFVFLSELFETLNELDNNFIAIGDFNLRAHYINPLIEFCKNRHIKQLIETPTRQQHILDLIFTNESNFIVNSKVYDANVADHFVTECTVNLKKPKLVCSSKPVRNYEKIDRMKMNGMLDEAFSQNEYNAPEITSKLINIFDKLCPLFTKTFKANHRPVQLSKSTKQLIKKKSSTYKIHKRMPSVATQNDLKVLKQKIKTAIYHDTKSHYNRIFTESGFWRGINNNILKKSNNVRFDLSAEDINNHYVSISTCTNTSPSIPLPPSNLFTCTNVFEIKMTNIDLVRKVWFTMNRRQSYATDPLGICNKMIDICITSDKFCLALKNMYNQFIQSGEVHEALKTSRIVPIPKVENPKSPNETRPIGIQTVLIKLFDKIVLKQLSDYIYENNIMSPTQFGFRPGLSTSHALVAMTDFIYSELDKNKFCIILSLDIVKAYDKLQRQILKSKLRWYGIDCKVLDSLLENRMQYVECDDCNGKRSKSTIKGTTLGVIQGSAISNILFALMLNDMPHAIKHCKVFSFADDTYLCISGYLHEENIVINAIENDLNSVSNWYNCNVFELNVKKCEFMVTARKNVLRRLTINSLKSNCGVVQRVKNMKILGVHFDECLSWNTHVNYVSKKCYSSLSLLYPLKHILSVEQKKILVSSFILSIINYAAVVWLGKTSSANLDKIDKIIKSAAKYVLMLRKFDSVSHEICHELEWLYSKYLYKYNLILFMHNTLRSTDNDYFYNYLDFSNSTVQCTRSQPYISPNVVTQSNWGKCTFKFRAVDEWLKIPDIEKKKITSTNSLRTKMFSYFLRYQISETACNIDQCEEDICMDDIINNVISKFCID